MAHPIRTCIGCGKTEVKQELLRLVRDDTDVEVDLPGHRPGRGAYVHRSRACIEAAIDGRRLGRAFRGRVAADPRLLAAVLEAAGIRGRDEEQDG